MITDYYTSTRFRPVRTPARASETGHASNSSRASTRASSPRRRRRSGSALGILWRNELAGIYGIGVAVMAQLSLTGLIVALDAFGPITDNAGGVAEMADLPEEVRDVTDPLDAVGNTTKAVTKGYAIGPPCSPPWCCSRVPRGAAARSGHDGERAGKLFDFADPKVLIGLLVRRLDALPVRGARDRYPVGTRRRPGRGGGPSPVQGAAGDHARGRSSRIMPLWFAIVTATAQREMIAPSLIRIVVTSAGRPPGPTKALGGLLIGDRRRLIHGDLDHRRRRAWDSAKQLIEDGEYGGKGSEAQRGVGHR